MEMDLVCFKNCGNNYRSHFANKALMLPHITKTEILGFLNNIWQTSNSAKDFVGRSPLHIAASLGNIQVCKWLILNKQLKIDDKDLESGYTALHRSIYYGQLANAVHLISLGANVRQLDNDGLSPLDHAALDNLQEGTEVNSPLLHVWGSNLNYTLGTQHSKPNPDVLDCFHKAYPNKEVSSIYLEKFHTVILTKDGEAFSLGHGQGGRLGLGSDSTVLRPTLIKFVKRTSQEPVKIIKAALGRDHSLFLSDAGQVWTCGLNNFKVLGVGSSVEKLLTPALVPKIKHKIEGICCSQYHSVAWSRDAVYTWGLNGGQLGHDECLSEDSFINTPKMITQLDQNRKIVSVTASLGSTVVQTNSEVFLFNSFQCRRILKSFIGIKSIEAFGGKALNTEKKYQELKVLILMNVGKMFLWTESIPYLSRCIFQINRFLCVQQAKLFEDGVVFLTADQEVFTGSFKYPKKIDKTVEKKSKRFNKFLDVKKCVTVQVKQVSRIYGVKYITSDTDGHNFACLTLNSKSLLKSVPEIGESTMHEDCRKLLEDSVVDPDGYFKVQGNTFEAHKYIVANASDKLLTLMENHEEISVHKEIFKEILKYIYSGTCAFTQVGSLNKGLRKAVDISLDSCNNKDAIKFMQTTAKRFELKTLVKDLEKFVYQEGFIGRNQKKQFTPKMLRFNFDDFPKLCDVTIKSNTPDQELKAHRCILACRSEFFMNLLSVRWNQSNFTVINLPYSIESIRLLIAYIYADQVNLDNLDLDSLLDLLVLSDHILLDRLVQICEFTLTQHLSSKNVMKILTVAHLCNASQLKVACMEFIYLNLALFLETRSLELLEDDLVQELSNQYAGWNTRIKTRSTLQSQSCELLEEYIQNINRQNPSGLEPVCNMVKTSISRRRRRTKSNNFETDYKTQVNNLTSSFEEVEIVNEKESLPFSSTPIRIQAISKAHQIIQETSVEDEEDFVSLICNKEFPNLGGSYDSGVHEHHFQKSPTPNSFKSRMKPRMSQKERKRLFSENSNEIKETVISESPKNPWNMNFESSSPSTSVNLFGNILTEERKQKENLNRIKSKLLMYTQIEDKAIEDLSKFYGVDTVSDEIIEVQRVDYGLYATPIWVQK